MRIVVVLIFFAAAHAGVRGQIVTFSFTGAVGNEATFAADAQPLNATVTSMTRGSGLNASSAANEFGASNWTLSGSPDAADYFEFSIAPETGYVLSLTSLTLDERRSPTGIRNWTVRTSVDNYTTSVGTFGVPDDTAVRTFQSITLTSGFTALSSSVGFRIYGYAAEGTSGTWRIDNVRLNGTISAVPEPSTYAAIGGLAALICAIWRRKRSSIEPREKARVSSSAM